MADLRARSRRHALLAAHADHARQCRPAEVAWVYHMRPPPHRRAAPAAERPPRAAGGTRPRTGPRRLGLRPERDHAARRQRRDVHLDAVRPRRRAGPDDRQGGLGLPAPPGNPSTRGVEYWPGDAQTPPRSSSARATAKLFSLDAKTGKPNEAFGDKGIVDFNTPEIMQGLPGSNGLSSPPIVYRNLVITGGRTQENPPQGPAGDVRAWDIHTGKLVWTFRSVPRAGEKFNDTWAGDSWKKRSGVNVWGFMTVDAAARHRLHAVRRAVGRSVRRRPPRRQPVRQRASSRPTRTPASTCGTSRSCITTSGTPIWPARRRSST